VIALYLLFGVLISWFGVVRRPPRLATPQIVFVVAILVILTWPIWAVVMVWPKKSEAESAGTRSSTGDS